MHVDLQEIKNPEDMLGGQVQRIDRRDILKYGLAGMLGMMVPLFPGKSALAAAGSAWRVNLKQAHTGEKFSGVYRVGDKYLPEAFERLNYVLRDHRSNEVFPMDPRALDILSALQSKIGPDKTVHILSGYRSPKTNAMLRNASSGVAKNSMHMYGQAIDLRVPGYSTARLRNMAKSLKAGGVGYYPKSDFVHVDTGKVRSW